MLETFQPQGNTVALKATSTGASTAVQPSAGAIIGCRLVNACTDYCYVAFGSSTIAATAPTTSTPANGMPMPSGAVETFNFSPNCYVSVVTTAASGTVFYTPGFGV